MATEAAGKFGVTVDVEKRCRPWPAPRPPRRRPRGQLLEQAIRQVYDREALPQGIGGGTVAAFFRKAGLCLRRSG